MAITELKRRAYKETNMALKDGDLIRMPCEICGKTPAHAHHDDYSQPLKIRWLCPNHHRKVHRTLKINFTCPICDMSSNYTRKDNTRRCQKCGYEGPKKEFVKGG